MSIKKSKKREHGLVKVPIDRERWAAIQSQLPPAGREVLQRLLDAVAAQGGDLPEGLLKDIYAISIEGVDPMWQVASLQEIMNRWLKLH